MPDRPATSRPRAGSVRARPHRAVTGRAIVLGALVVVLLVLLASPLNRYFTSRSDLNGAAQQLHSDKQQLHELNKQYRQWSDPGFIQQQARQRLQYAMPGDTVYVVVDQGAKSDIQKSEATPSQEAAGSWNTRLWSSVEQAAK
jgi:cell division protein FtsB